MTRLGVDLLIEASKRAGTSRNVRPLLDDARVQAAYCIDAPDEVQDGMMWWQDPEFDDVHGAVPRVVSIRGVSGA